MCLHTPTPPYCFSKWRQENRIKIVKDKKKFKWGPNNPIDKVFARNLEEIPISYFKNIMRTAFKKRRTHLCHNVFKIWGWENQIYSGIVNELELMISNSGKIFCNCNVFTLCMLDNWISSQISTSLIIRINACECFNW